MADVSFVQSSNSSDDQDSVSERNRITGCSETCWLCENHNNSMANDFSAFVVLHAQKMSPLQMAKMLREEIHDGRLAMQMADGAGDPVVEIGLPTADEILRHIKCHMLHPNVQVSQILRNLLDMAEALREVAVSKGEDGSPLIDVRSVSVYLKVVSEIMQIYRTADLTKMAFAEQEQ